MDKLQEKPTIEELEKILEAPDCQYRIELLPDGSIKAVENEKAKILTFRKSRLGNSY